MKSICALQLLYTGQYTFGNHVELSHISCSPQKQHTHLYIYINFHTKTIFESAEHQKSISMENNAHKSHFWLCIWFFSSDFLFSFTISIFRPNFSTVGFNCISSHMWLEPTLLGIQCNVNVWCNLISLKSWHQQTMKCAEF